MNPQEQSKAQERLEGKARTSKELLSHYWGNTWGMIPAYIQLKNQRKTPTEDREDFIIKAKKAFIEGLEASIEAIENKTIPVEDAIDIEVLQNIISKAKEIDPYDLEAVNELNTIIKTKLGK